MSKNNNGWAPHLISRVEEIDIDPEIEKEIAQLQEANFAEKIKEIKLVEKKQEQKVELADELGSFFGAITKAKVDLTEKIEKEEVKIEGLEELFNELASTKKKKKEKKKVLLVEPEKEIVPQVSTKEIITELEQLVVVEETIEEAVEDKAVDKMIEKVKKQISSMKNANELDKERVRQLSDLDSWEKLKEEFLNFKHTVNVQLGTVGGGGLDPHNIYSDFLPSQTNTYDLGSADRNWKDLHLSGSLITDGVVTGTGFTIGSAVITEAELEILDGATVTTTELNLIDGGTSRGTDALASGDGILINDAGTMKMTNVDTVSTYFASHNVGGGNIVTTGALNSGSITSGFGTIDTGSSTITTTGDITGGTLAATSDTAAGDNASIGYTAAEGLILTGQGSTNDVTIKNDADADVISIPTGATNVTIAGVVTATGFTIGSAAITEAELEILDGANVTTAELNTIDMSASSSSSGQLLTSRGTGSTPTWQDAPQGVSNSKLFYYGSFS